MNFTIDEQVFAEFQNFFLQCQTYQQKVYNFENNYFTNPSLNKDFVNSTTSTKTYGYSEELFRYWKYFDGNFKPYEFQRHIMNKKPIRLAYLDQFIAKDPQNQADKKTILRFNKFMISTPILEIYTQGLYLVKPNTNKWSSYTYLLPPTKFYFQWQGRQSDQNYKQLYNLFIYSKQNVTATYRSLYGQAYLKNSKKLTGDIKTRLESGKKK